MIITTKTKNIVLLALVSTFIMSIVSYTTQQSFAQGLFQSQQSERNQSSVSPPPITTEEDEDKSEVANQQQMMIKKLF